MLPSPECNSLLVSVGLCSLLLESTDSLNLGDSQSSSFLLWGCGLPLRSVRYDPPPVVVVLILLAGSTLEMVFPRPEDHVSRDSSSHVSGSSLSMQESNQPLVAPWGTSLLHAFYGKSCIFLFCLLGCPSICPMFLSIPVDSGSSGFLSLEPFSSYCLKNITDPPFIIDRRPRSATPDNSTRPITLSTRYPSDSYCPLLTRAIRVCLAFPWPSEILRSLQRFFPAKGLCPSPF